MEGSAIQHLWEIESAGAFDLGEITRLQQEKIEEIYLHLIALQQEVEYLEIELVPRPVVGV